VVLCGVLPDIDGLGLFAEMATEHSARPLTWWSEYHHVLCHNVGFGLALAIVVAILAERRWAAVGLGLVAFHLHLLGDLVGSRGPDGYQWPIPYLLPFSNHWQLAWKGQWVLNAWPNVLLTAVLLGLTMYLAWRRGYSPVGIISEKADDAFVSTLRARFGDPRASHA
jgi:inner membrane protein